MGRHSVYRTAQLPCGKSGKRTAQHTVRDKESERVVSRKYTYKMTLSVDSIERAIERIEEYKKKVDPERIAEKAITALINAAMANYGQSGESIVYDYRRLDDTMWMVEFSTPGSPQIVFLEFGTGNPVAQGAYVDGMAKELGIGIYSGSWSEDHANKWKEWIDAGKDPAKFPYNHYPRRGIFYGMNAAREEITRILRAR